jgi:hypothetical protein
MNGETITTAGITETRGTRRTGRTTRTRGTTIRRGQNSFVIVNAAGLDIDEVPFNTGTPNDESNEERKEDKNETKPLSKKKLSPIPEDGLTSESNHSIPNPIPILESPGNIVSEVESNSVPTKNIRKLPKNSNAIDEKSIVTKPKYVRNIELTVLKPTSKVVILKHLKGFENYKDETKDFLKEGNIDFKLKFEEKNDLFIIGRVLNCELDKIGKEKITLKYKVKLIQFYNINSNEWSDINGNNIDAEVMDFFVYYTKDGKFIQEDSDIMYIGDFFRIYRNNENQFGPIKPTKIRKSKESKKGGKNKTKKHRR